jgi:hypothetical protein
MRKGVKLADATFSFLRQRLQKSHYDRRACTNLSAECQSVNLADERQNKQPHGPAFENEKPQLWPALVMKKGASSASRSDAPNANSPKRNLYPFSQS